jgi:CHAT domain-containing protein/Tfp pilus assembly protein PilF
MNSTVCVIALLMPLSILRGAPRDESGLKELYDQGTQAVRTKDLAAAEKAFRVGLDRATAAGDKAWAARFSQSIGEVDVGRGQMREAALDYSRALAWYEELSDSTAAAGVQDVLGQIQARLGRFEDAEKSLTRALSVYAASGNTRRTAKVRGSLADLYVRRSDFRAALENGFLALDEDEKAADNRETAKVLDVLGNAFHLMGQSESALRYYRRKLSFRESGGQDLAFSYRNMGAALADLGRYAEALDYFKESMELGKAAGSSLEIANSTISIGVSERALGNVAAARASFEEALAVSEQHGLKLQAATSLYSLGDLSLAAGELDRALSLHQRALKIREDAQSPRDVVWSLNRLGIVLEDRGDLKAAEQTHERALGEFERIGAGISDPTQYGGYRRTSMVLYPHYARVLLKLGKTWESLRISERSRGVGLARMTALNGANFVDLLGPEDAKAWQDVSARLGRASNQLRVLEQANEGAAQDVPRSLDEARALYFQTERELWNLRDRLFASSPGLRTKAAPQAVATEQLQALSRKSPGTLFLEWMIVDAKSTLLFALSADGLQAFELNTGSPELLAASNAWRSSLSAGAFGPATVAERALQNEEPRLARRLYDLLFSKVEPLVESGKYSRLVLVGEGPLLDLPFPALVDAKSNRLMDRFAISNSVSFEYLLRPPARAKGRSLLSVADPLGQKERRLVVPSNQEYEHLQDALPEAKAVAGMYRGSLLLAGPSAREAEIKLRLPEFTFLHFATHGILDASDNLRSGLLLATEPRDSSEDGVLEAWEILSLSLSARLVFLSACDTARGKERLGDGLLSLAWAFQAAGSPRVVASLWSVDDQATRELVTSFYAHLRAGERVDDALREAMQRERKNPRYTSPYFWSAFQILGDASALQ